MCLRFILFAIIVSAGSGCRTSDPAYKAGSAAREIAVAAAADLRFALDEIVREFGKKHPQVRVSITYGSSGNLYSQIANQAPFDMFLSADSIYPQRLSQAGLTLQDSEFVYAVGRIVLWVPSRSPIEVEKLHMNALKLPSVAHVAIANPQHAPYGRAAEAAMSAAGIYDAVKAKLVLGENISQTLQFVQSGSAEIGIVALSLAVAPTVRQQGRFWELPPETYPTMQQGGVILKHARDADAARQFRSFMMAPSGRSILKSYGFSFQEE